MAEPKLFTVDKQLVEWLNEREKTDFPSVTQGENDTYPNRYLQACRVLDPYHDDIQTRALMLSATEMIRNENFNADQLIYLNNHGKGHVKAVIEKASEILMSSKCKITAYEGYLLLMAIQFHDVGIVFGRDKHNTACWNLMNRLGGAIGADRPEQKEIIRLAASHGGEIDGNKDTISKLQKEADLMGQSGIRMAFLAAVLRLSDELADDSTRSSVTTVEFKDFPIESKLFHYYSLALQPAIIRDGKVILQFDLDKNNLTEKYSKFIKLKSTGKPSIKKIFLIDEIYERTWKMFNELLYCGRFLRPFVEIREIHVKIHIYPFDEDLFGEQNEQITYVLKEDGYPGFKPRDIYAFCPLLKDKTGGKLRLKFFQKTKR